LLISIKRFLYLYDISLEESISMSTSTHDDTKGRVKEATGAVTGNDELKREGQRDQAAGKIKETAEKVVDKAKDILGGGDKEEK
jgi:uncharacterized protein YjbJ (UPF0337 family)